MCSIYSKSVNRSLPSQIGGTLWNFWAMQMQSVWRPDLKNSVERDCENFGKCLVLMKYSALRNSYIWLSQPRNSQLQANKTPSPSMSWSTTHHVTIFFSWLVETHQFVELWRSRKGGKKVVLASANLKFSCKTFRRGAHCGYFGFY